MDKHGYTWEPHTVTTDDGYNLTTFHVTGKVAEEPYIPTLPPILIQHSMSYDAAKWLSSYTSGVPMPLQLADAGYDVWMGNNRGKEYSQTHVRYSVDDAEYWNFGWAEMGLYDVVANVKLIQNETGKDKIIYLGW